MFASEFLLGRFLRLSYLYIDHGHLPSNQSSWKHYLWILWRGDFQEAVLIVADFNIHLECSDDPITKQLTDLLCDYWFSVRPTTATHNAGGTNDAVTACCIINDSQLNVSVADVGLSHHHLLTWPLRGHKMPPASQTICCCPWSQLDITQSTSFKASLLCQSTMWPDDTDDI